MSNTKDYFKRKIAKSRQAELVAGMILALGSCISAGGLLLRVSMLVFVGFPILFSGLYLSVHYEVKRLNYINMIEKIAPQGS
ncbi:MAG: hypothetical protein NWE78_00070 [Candidatus Bathyarchaeota archaeon]|nr:hypothetical protein [Candidatus Bathyarchaeota archaeon]